MACGQRSVRRSLLKPNTLPAKSTKGLDTNTNRSPTAMLKPAIPPAHAVTSAQTRRSRSRSTRAWASPRRALRMVWPIVCAADWKNSPTSTPCSSSKSCAFSFRAIYAQAVQNARPTNSVSSQAARARGVVIGPKTYRRLSDKPRGRRPGVFKGPLGRDGTVP